MLLSYNADLLPKVRMMGCIRYSQPWIHFARIIDEYILYVIRSGDLYLREDGETWHLTADDFFLLEPGLPHEGYQKAVCEYYYVHFTHPDMGRVADEEAAVTELAEKRRQCLLPDNIPGRAAFRQPAEKYVHASIYPAQADGRMAAAVGGFVCRGTVAAAAFFALCTSAGIFPAMYGGGEGPSARN